MRFGNFIKLNFILLNFIKVSNTYIKTREYNRYNKNINFYSLYIIEEKIYNDIYIFLK